ncbi:transporter [Ganoderma sinense ZZ0214-1]|uniref:Transporter n=1 Tax=Ganoderma sinense ZZ0214-1 TaxID=1077348 RepID=A0A2G8S3A2_9APHY|nr:transporter [Ganoderma sinense ZZ0214-1]
MSQQITLYSAKICPFAHRAEIALAEAKAPFTRYEIDLSNKPQWYAPKVNAASKVPAMTYGGPAVPADQPSPESTKLAESLVLVEFVGDLFPSSGIVPADPVKRAQARFFIEGVSSKLLPAYFALQMKGAPPADFYAALEYLQALLPRAEEGEGAFAVDEYSMADIAITPFLARARMSFDNDLGAWEKGEGPKMWETVTSGRFARLAKYIDDLFARESFKATWDEEYVLTGFKKHFAELRK